MGTHLYSLKSNLQITTDKMVLCGGMAEPIGGAPEELQNAVNEHKDVILAKSGHTGESLTVISYATQVVSGTNYFAKIQVDGSDTHIHARIFKDLPHRGG